MFLVGKKSRQRTELLLGVDSPGVDHLGTVLDDLLDLAGGEQVLKAQLEADNRISCQFLNLEDRN